MAGGTGKGTRMAFRGGPMESGEATRTGASLPAASLPVGSVQPDAPAPARLALRGTSTSAGSTRPEVVGRRIRRAGATLRGTIKRWIPFGVKRKREMATYSKRHYGRREWRLIRPRVIVEHISVAPNVGSVWKAFASDRPDPELGELPNVCAHFVVSATGRVYQLVGLKRRCRHTIGLNQVAIGIEHIGFRDRDLLRNRREMRSSVRLTWRLRCRYGIPVRDVIGHRESLRSPYHRERIARLRHRTHGDLGRSSMRRYRRELRRMGRCPR